MSDHRESVVLINLDNGQRAKVACADDPDRKETSYIDHLDLLDWAGKTGCTERVRKMWNPKNKDKTPFLAFEDDGLDYSLAIYKNPHETDYVARNEELAFLAVRAKALGKKAMEQIRDRPNAIPGKGGHRGARRK